MAKRIKHIKAHELAKGQRGAQSIQRIQELVTGYLHQHTEVAAEQPPGIGRHDHPGCLHPGRSVRPDVSRPQNAQKQHPQPAEPAHPGTFAGHRQQWTGHADTVCIRRPERADGGVYRSGDDRADRYHGGHDRGAFWQMGRRGADVHRQHRINRTFHTPS